MRVDVVTLFPEIFSGFLETSFVGRAREAGKLEVRTKSPRDFGIGRHRSVDDTPYGGGSGMVMRVDVLVACIESLADEAAQAGAAEDAGTPSPPVSPAEKPWRVLLTPQGKPLTQIVVRTLAARPSLVLVCGRYEGFDERVRAYVDEEVSLGDFVMTGGEVAAMAIIDACVRLLPGVLGNEESTKEESHAPETQGLLEYPQYTRPKDFRGAVVPDALLSGHHKEIAAWRRAQSIMRTRDRRPDLHARFEAAAAPDGRAGEDKKSASSEKKRKS